MRFPLEQGKPAHISTEAIRSVSHMWTGGLEGRVYNSKSGAEDLKGSALHRRGPGMVSPDLVNINRRRRGEKVSS